MRNTVGDHNSNHSSASADQLTVPVPQVLVVLDLLSHLLPTSLQETSSVIHLQTAQSSRESGVVQVLLKSNVVFDLLSVSHNTESGLASKWSSRVFDGLGHVSHSVEHFHPGVTHAGGGVEQHKVVNVARVFGLNITLAVALAVVGSFHFGDLSIVGELGRGTGH